MTQKYSNSEIFHTWMYDQSSDIENTNGTIFSEGKKIYSYGYHYVMAQFVTTNKGEEILLVNSNTYSNTTSKQMGKLRSSIPFNTKVLYLSEASINHKQNFNGYMYEIKYNIDKSTRATKNKDFYIEEAESIKSDLIYYLENFNTGIRLNKDEKTLLNSSLDENDIKLLKDANKRRKQAEKRAKRKANEQKYLELQKNIERWKSNELSYLHTNDEVYLRRKGDSIETSQGASVPIQHARYLFGRIRQKEAIKNTHIQNYLIKGIEDNNLIIGCHTIPLKEVNRLAKELKW